MPPNASAIRSYLASGVNDNGDALRTQFLCNSFQIKKRVHQLDLPICFIFRPRFYIHSTSNSAVVDDDENYRELVSERFFFEGYKVFQFFNFSIFQNLFYKKSHLATVSSSMPEKPNALSPSTASTRSFVFACAA
jgi:hypothetical protein